MKKRPLLGILLLLIVTKTAFAQSNDLDSVVVTANLITQKGNQTGKSVIVIAGTDLEKLPITSLDELLKYLPGIEVQQRGINGTQSDIIIRGGSFQQVLVLIDGVRMNDPLTGHFNGYIPLHPEDIYKIEIIKGAAATIYGPDAIGGVIHVITRKKTTAQINKLSAGTKFGSFGLNNTNLWWGMNNAKWKLSLGHLTNKADGETLRGTTGYFNNKASSVLFNYYLPKNWKLNLLYIQDSRNFNAQNFYTQFKSDTASEIVKSQWAQIGLIKEANSIVFKTDIGYKQLSDQYRFNPAGKYNENNTSLLVAQSNLQWTLNEEHQLVTGIQYLHKKINSNDRGNHALTHAGAFVVFNHRLPNNITLNESARMDWDENYGLAFLPQLNAAWSIKKITIRSSIGKGIRDADFTERYNNYKKTLVTAGNIGNPNLQAEKSWSYELGTDIALATNLKWSTTFFYRAQHDLIDWAPTIYSNMPRTSNLIPTGNYALATNKTSVKTKGLEIEFTYTKTWSEKLKLQYLSGLVWLDTKDADKQPSFYITSHAKFLWNQQLILKTGQLQWALNSIYKVRNKQTATAILTEVSSNYFLMNYKVSYTSKNGYFNLFTETNNLFDKKYSDLLGAKMPGRWISIGTQIKL